MSPEQTPSAYETAKLNHAELLGNLPVSREAVLGSLETLNQTGSHAALTQEIGVIVFAGNMVTACDELLQLDEQGSIQPPLADDNRATVSRLREQSQTILERNSGGGNGPTDTKDVKTGGAK